MADRDTNWLDWLTMTLVIIGALNWGLMGLAGFVEGNEQAWNVVDMVFGTIPEVEWLIYLLVGLAGLYQIYFGYKVADRDRTADTSV